MGWYNDPYGENSVRYNLLLPRRVPFLYPKVIGTIEFTPFDPAHSYSSVEGPNRSSLSSYADIAAFQARTWEIDKLCIRRSYQRSGYFQGFFHIFYDHAMRYSPKFYVALIEKKLYRMLRMLGLAVEQRGQAFAGPNTSLVPVVFGVESIMNQPERVQTYLQMNRA